MSAEQRAARADRFRSFLEEEGFGEELAGWEKTLYEKFLTLDAHQDKERFRLQVAINMSRQLEGWVSRAIADGKVARKELREIMRGKTRRAFF